MCVKSTLPNECAAAAVNRVAQSLKFVRYIYVVLVEYVQLAGYFGSSLGNNVRTLVKVFRDNTSILLTLEIQSL